MRGDWNRFVAGLTLFSAVGSAGLGAAQTAPSLPSSLHVVLLQATNAPVAPPTTLPPTILAALKGATASRPFKSLHLLDQAVVRVQGPGMTRLKGPANSEFVLAVSSGTVTASTANEVGAAVHLFQTRDGVLEPTAPEVLWAEFTAKPGESVFVWPWEEKAAGGEPLVLLVTPLTRQVAATFLQAAAKQAADSLVASLDGECAMVVEAARPAGAAPAAPPSSPPAWRIAKVRVENRELLFERAGTGQPSAVAAAAKPPGYRVVLRNMTAPELRVGFGARAEEPFAAFSLPCASAGCVTIDGAPEAGLGLQVCAGQATAFLKAIQMLIVQAGGGWDGQ